MTQSVWLLIFAVVIALLAWNLWKRLGADRMQRLNDVRRKTCRLVGIGELIDGSRHIPVALAVSNSTFYYENSEMRGSLELDSVQEVEYENELVTGQAVSHGRVLRLRCFSRVFEFILDNAAIPQWQAILPSVRQA
ncbi:MAG TPA: hypothetical protein VGK04_05430 [Thermoanaerobaculia bacterium]|jgi:hypothetical protein